MAFSICAFQPPVTISSGWSAIRSAETEFPIATASPGCRCPCSNSRRARITSPPGSTAAPNCRCAPCIRIRCRNRPSRKAEICVRQAKEAYMTIRRKLFATAATLASLATAALFTGCAVAPSATAPRVQEADAQMVTSCKYVGYVQGSNGAGNLAPSAAMKYAKQQAKEYAASLGATDVVWDSVPQVHDAGYPWPAAPYL